MRSDKAVRVRMAERGVGIGLTAAMFAQPDERLNALLRDRARPADVWWSHANRCVVDAARRGDWLTVARTYVEMAALLVAEGRAADDVIEEALQALRRVPADQRSCSASSRNSSGTAAPVRHTTGR